MKVIRNKRLGTVADSDDSSAYRYIKTTRYLDIINQKKGLKEVYRVTSTQDNVQLPTEH